MDTQHIEALWHEARKYPDPWKQFFMTAYCVGPETLDNP